MAITIKVQPQEFQSAFNDIMVVLDSDKKNEPKFQYIVDISIDGTYSSRLKIQSNPQGYGVFNIRKHLEPYVKGSLNITDKKTFKIIPDSYAKYSVSLKEEYVLTSSFTSVTNSGGLAQYNFSSNPMFEAGEYINISGVTSPLLDGIQKIISVGTNSVITEKAFTSTTTGTAVLSNNTPTQIDDPATITNKFTLNNVVNWIDVPNFNASDYICNGLESKHFTTLPQYAKVYRDDRYTMNIYNKISNNAAGLEVQTSRGIYRINNTYATSIDETKFLSVGIGVFDLENTSDAITVVSGSLPMFDSSVVDYNVRLINASNTPIGELRRFKVNNRCNKSEGTRMIYLNRNGSYSTFNFALNTKKKVSVRKKSFSSNFGSYNPSNNTYGYESSASGLSRLDTTIKETFTSQSDYLHERDGNLIQELIASPEVYILEDNLKSLDSSISLNNFANTSGGLVQLTTSSNHNMVLGDIITLQGFSDKEMKGNHKVVEILSNTSLIIEKGATINGYNCVSGESIAKEIFSSDGSLRSIEIKTSSINLKSNKTDGLVSYKIDWNYTTSNKTQN